MSPHLVKWDKAYRERGLTIIDINNGAIDSYDALAKYVKKQGKRYPTLWDKGGKVCKSFAVRGYPAAFLVGADGKVIWEGYPNPELAMVEERIVKELEKVAESTEQKPGVPVRTGKKGEKVERKKLVPPQTKGKAKGKAKAKTKDEQGRSRV